ncbi:MAG TPA: hypothetical protein VN803_03255 [Gemmatimonadales bacterium]|nr:hypothetical protein [Gemmatimonadales bacterium]
MIYEAKSSFSTEDSAGRRVHVGDGDTVREGHWLLDRIPDAFRPLRVTFEVEQEAVKEKKPAAVPAPAVA